MRKNLNIPVFICLLGLTLPGAGYFCPAAAQAEYPISGSGITHDRNSEVSPTKIPALFIAESLREARSEIEPRISLYAGGANHENRPFPQLQSLSLASFFEISQSIRTLIFPFHSHL